MSGSLSSVRPPFGYVNPQQLSRKSGLSAGKIRTVDDVDAYTLTVSDLLSGYITSSALTAAATWTLPTDALMLAAGLQQGEQFSVVLRNANGAGENITLAAGGASILYGPTVIAPSSVAILDVLILGTDGDYACFVRPPIASGGVASSGGAVSSVAAAITAATTLTAADSGGVFSVSQAAAYDIDLPAAERGLRFLFYLTGAAANNVTITVAGAASTFVGTIINDVTSVIPATGATLTFASGNAALGDSIEAIGISTSLYLIRAVTSTASGITVA